MLEMETSSDSDGTHSPGFYGQVTYTTTSVTGYDDPTIKSPSPHSESSGSGSVDEPCSKAHHKFSIDRILGRFNGDNAATTAIDSCPETSEPGKLHRNELALRNSGKFDHQNIIVTIV